MDDTSDDLGFFQQPKNDTFPLDGARYNPLDNFKRYRGGYSIDNDDYWASLAFLGIWGYGIAAIILVVGIIWVIVNFFRFGYRCCCGSRSSSDDSDQKEGSGKEVQQPKYIYLLNIIICVIALLGAGITIYGGTKMIDAVDDTTDTMIITVNVLSSNASIIEDIVRDSYNSLESLAESNSDIISNLDEILENAEEAEKEVEDYVKEIDDIVMVVDDNDDELKDLYDDVHLGFIIMSAVVGGVILIGTVLMFTSRRLYNKYFSQLFIPSANILAVFIWISFGLVLVLRNFENDSCESFDEWNRGWIEDLSPSGDLTDIIPCPDNETVVDVFDTLDQIIYDVITVANLGVEYFETESGEDLSNFYFCYPPLSPNVQPPPDLNMPDTCQDINATSIASPDCTYLSSELCDELETFFMDVIPDLLEIVLDVLEAREILFVAVSCEFVYNLFTWIIDVQCVDDDWDALEGATDVTLVGLGILGSILVLASIFWIFLRNRKRTSSPLSKDDREKDRSPSNASKAKDNKDRLPPKSRRAKNERVRDPPKTFEMVAKK